MKRLIGLCFLLVSMRSFSQDSIACYYDKHFNETTIKDSAAYFKVGKKDDLDHWTGMVKTYFISGKIAGRVLFNDGKPIGVGQFYHENGKTEETGPYLGGLKSGTWKNYHANGQLRYEGLFEEGRRSGEWNEYHDNGQLSNEGRYEKGDPAGTWKNYYANGKMQNTGEYEQGFKTGLWRDYYMNGNLKWEIKHVPVRDKKNQYIQSMITFSDSLGNVTVKEGTGHYLYYDKKDDFTEEGNYKAGEKNGEWIGSSLHSKTAYTEKYENGKLVKGKSTDKEGKEYKYTELQTTAEYPGGMEEMRKFLAKNIVYPRKARNRDIQGKVYIEFVIDTKGAITNVKLKRGVEAELDMEALRVVKQMPDWEPATNRGKKVKQRYVLPVNFKIT